MSNKNVTLSNISNYLCDQTNMKLFLWSFDPSDLSSDPLRCSDPQVGNLVGGLADTSFLPRCLRVWGWCHPVGVEPHRNIQTGTVWALFRLCKPFFNGLRVQRSAGWARPGPALPVWARLSCKTSRTETAVIRRINSMFLLSVWVAQTLIGLCEADTVLEDGSCCEALRWHHLLGHVIGMENRTNSRCDSSPLKQSALDPSTDSHSATLSMSYSEEHHGGM